MSSLLKFFSITYAVTWTCFIAAALLSSSVTSGVPALAGLRWPLMILGAFAPSTVALWLTIALLWISTGYFLVRMSREGALKQQRSL